MLEKTIIANLIHNDDYSRKVLPFIKDEYFEEIETKTIFTSIREYTDKYKDLPSIEALKITIDDRKDLNEDMFKNVIKVVDELKIDEKTSEEWLLNETEKFCQDRDLFNSVRKAILILDGADKEHDKGSIPKILSDSLSISFDNHIGHDYLGDFDERYDFYHRVEERLPFDIELLNRITKGGLPKKSLSVLLASTGVGKSLVMCHMAAASMMFGKNVLYITSEMAEERIAERIDANLLDVTLDDLRVLPKNTYEKRINKIRDKTNGNLIVKEYPTGVGHSGHFRHLLNELRLKKSFVPDIIFIDYLNICASSRIKGNSSVNSYTLIKSIAEEIRGLAMEFNVPIVSATQANRAGYDNTDMDLTNTSESIGLPQTVDFMVALMSSEELESTGKLLIKQLKNRWGDISENKRFVVGINRSKMKLFDLEESAQYSIQNEPKQDHTDDKFKFNKQKKSLSIEGMK